MRVNGRIVRDPVQREEFDPVKFDERERRRDRWRDCDPLDCRGDLGRSRYFVLRKRPVLSNDLNVGARRYLLNELSETERLEI